MSPLLRDAKRSHTGAPARILEASRDEVLPVLFRAHCADLIRLAYVLTGDRGAAEEAVQDAYVSLYSHWDSMHDKAASRGYLRAAVVNRCRSVHRDKARRVRATEPLTPDILPLPGVDTEALNHDEAHRIAAMVRSLPRRQREVVVCRYYLDLTERETAAMLEVTVGSVKKHASRALTKLHDQLVVSL